MKLTPSLLRNFDTHSTPAFGRESPCARVLCICPEKFSCLKPPANEKQCIPLYIISILDAGFGKAPYQVSDGMKTAIKRQGIELDEARFEPRPLSVMDKDHSLFIYQYIAGDKLKTKGPRVGCDMEDGIDKAKVKLFPGVSLSLWPKAFMFPSKQNPVPRFFAEGVTQIEAMSLVVVELTPTKSDKAYVFNISGLSPVEGNFSSLQSSKAIEYLPKSLMETETKLLHTTEEYPDVSSYIDKNRLTFSISGDCVTKGFFVDDGATLVAASEDSDDDGANAGRYAELVFDEAIPELGDKSSILVLHSTLLAATNCADVTHAIALLNVLVQVPGAIEVVCVHSAFWPSKQQPAFRGIVILNVACVLDSLRTITKLNTDEGYVEYSDNWRTRISTLPDGTPCICHVTPWKLDIGDDAGEQQSDGDENSSCYLGVRIGLNSMDVADEEHQSRPVATRKGLGHPLFGLGAFSSPSSFSIVFDAVNGTSKCKQEPGKNDASDGEVSEMPYDIREEQLWRGWVDRATQTGVRKRKLSAMVV